MDKSSSNKVSVKDAGICEAKRIRRNLTAIQNNSSSHNFAKLSIENASNNVDRNKLKIFNGYVQSGLVN